MPIGYLMAVGVMAAGMLLATGRSDARAGRARSAGS